MRHFLMMLFVGLLFSGEALGRSHGGTGVGLLDLIIGLVQGIFNLVTALLVPLLIFGVYVFIRHIYPEIKKKK